jgi:Zn-finger nucleic acid-binding protein
MKCPLCNKAMVIETHEGEEVAACRSCRGMWLHKHQLNSLLKESGGDVESCSIGDTPHRDSHRAIKCLNCPDVTMKKVNFLDYSKIILDRCPSCGSYWLDNGELTKMHDYIRNIDEGTHEVKDRSAFSLLVSLSRMAFSIFR